MFECEHAGRVQECDSQVPLARCSRTVVLLGSLGCPAEHTAAAKEKKTTSGVAPAYSAARCGRIIGIRRRCRPPRRVADNQPDISLLQRPNHLNQAPRPPPTSSRRHSIHRTSPWQSPTAPPCTSPTQPMPGPSRWTRSGMRGPERAAGLRITTQIWWISPSASSATGRGSRLRRNLIRRRASSGSSGSEGIEQQKEEEQAKEMSRGGWVQRDAGRKLERLQKEAQSTSCGSAQKRNKSGGTGNQRDGDAAAAEAEAAPATASASAAPLLSTGFAPAMKSELRNKDLSNQQQQQPRQPHQPRRRRFFQKKRFGQDRSQPLHDDSRGKKLPTEKQHRQPAARPRPAHSPTPTNANPNVDAMLNLRIQPKRPLTLRNVFDDYQVRPPCRALQVGFFCLRSRGHYLLPLRKWRTE